MAPRVRQVVSFSHSKWMVYDRYGLLCSGNTLPSEPCLAPAAGADPCESSVPNTVPIGSEDDVALDPDALLYYDKVYQKRKGIADEVRADAGESEFTLGKSLRTTWIQAQRGDKTLMPMFHSKELRANYRLSIDGLLERQIHLPAPLLAVWVPIVPDGQATGNLS